MASIYIPHSNIKALKQFLTALDKGYNFCKENSITYFQVMGDFNARHTAWGDTGINRHGTILADYLTTIDGDVELCSPHTPTFRCQSDGTNGSSVIDLTLCNTACKERILINAVDEVYNLGTGAPGRGHLPVITILADTDFCNSKDKVRSVWNYSKVNWKDWALAVEEVCRERKAYLEGEHDTVLKYRMLIDILQEANSRIMTKKIICRHSKPYWNNNLTSLAKAVNKAAKAYKKCNTPCNSARWNKAQIEFRDGVAIAINDWIEKKASSLNNSKLVGFWKKYKKYFKNQSSGGVEILKDMNNNYKTDDAEKIEILKNTFFRGDHLHNMDFDEETASEINTEVDSLLKDKVHSDNNNHINCDFTMEELNQAISKISTSDKSPDPDGIHPRMIKESGINFREQILDLANNVLRTGKWVWNTSKVIFIKKENKKTYADPSSYRPLCLNSYIGKLIERLIETRLRHFMLTENLIDAQQEGFLAGCSTTRYLYRLTSKLKRISIRKLTGICLMVDFEKAFDSVWVKGLLHKLQHVGIVGRMWYLIADILLHRSVTIAVNDITSDLFSCGMGLPQGAILSPLLFIFYISDMPKSENIDTFKYADDQSALVTNHSLTLAHSNMQDFCDNLYSWCKKWRIKINCKVGKTEALILATPKNKVNLPLLKLGDTEIQYVDTSPVLGIKVDNKVSFDTQVKNAIGRALIKWWNIKKWCNNKWGLKHSTILVLIKAVILPAILYAAPAWAHGKAKDLSKIWYDMLNTACGGQFKPSIDILEELSGIPPLDLFMESINIKFMIKNFMNHDYDLLKEEVYIASSLPKHPTSSHLAQLKKYYSTLSRKVSKPPRLINLEDSNLKNHRYTKSSIREFLKYFWLKRTSHDPTTHTVLSQLKLNDLFSPVNLHTTRLMETFIFSLVHSKCVLNDFRYKVHLTGSPMCEYCQVARETPDHLLECNDTAHLQSKMSLTKVCKEKGLKESFTDITLSRDPDVLKAEVDFIKALKQIKVDIFSRDLLLEYRETQGEPYAVC